MKLKLFVILWFSVLLGFAQEEEGGWPEEVLDTNAYKGYYVQIKAAPMFTHNMFTKTIIEGYEDAISPEGFYKEKPTLLTDVTFGFRKSEWQIFTGLQYYAYEEDFELTQKQKVFMGSDSSFVDVTTQKTNRYQLLNLKLGAGYLIDMNQWLLDISAGVHFGFLLSKEGLTYDYKKKAIVDLEDNFQSFQGSYFLSANLKYKWSDNINLFIEPYYISGINSIWESSTVYAWKRVQYGAFVGVEYLISAKSKEE